MAQEDIASELLLHSIRLSLDHCYCRESLASVWPQSHTICSLYPSPQLNSWHETSLFS